MTISVDDETNMPVTVPVKAEPTVGTDGKFSFAVNLSSLNDGNLPATAIQTDAAGNSSPPTTAILTKQTTDVPPAEPALSIADMSVMEGDDGKTKLVFTVTLSEPADGKVKVNYRPCPVPLTPRARARTSRPAVAS